MPVIARILGIVLKMYFKDHSPPHLHAEDAECNGLFSIEDGEMTEGNLSSKTQKIVQEWTLKNKEKLNEMWNTQKIEKI
jgi:hypothetical protein